MLYVRREDYTAASSWRLLEWCRTRGADEFALVFLGPPYVPGTAWAEWDALLAPFRRRVASAGDRWQLTGESVAVLEEMLPEGLLGGGWSGDRDRRGAPDGTGGTGVGAKLDESGRREMQVVRDPAVYRGGALLLAVDTEAGEGMFTLRHGDQDSLEDAGLPFRRTAKVR